MAVRLWVVVLTLAALLVVDRREWAEPGFSVAWCWFQQVFEGTGGTEPPPAISIGVLAISLAEPSTTYSAPAQGHTWMPAYLGSADTGAHFVHSHSHSHTHTYQQTHQGAPSGWFHAHWSHAGTFLNWAPPWSPAGSSRAPGSLAASESLCALPSSLLHSPCDHVAESLDCPQTSSLVYGTDQVTYDNDCQLCLTRM
nr:PREDICTED: serine protease inhibitor Kazal-type 4 [Equus przewalskii]